jgi:hypothetical protein
MTIRGNFRPGPAIGKPNGLTTPKRGQYLVSEFAEFPAVLFNRCCGEQRIQALLWGDYW